MQRVLGGRGWRAGGSGLNLRRVSSHAVTGSGEDRPVVFLDLEAVIIESRPGRTDYTMRPQAQEGLRGLAQVADPLVGLIEPPAHGSRRARAVDRLDGIRAPMVRGGPELLFVGCPHRDVPCGCRKPGTGLVDLTAHRYGVQKRGGWYIAGDQGGVQAGRNAGLHTIRIGPLAGDHLSAVHRPDYEARDLLDAANWILVQSLTPTVQRA